MDAFNNLSEEKRQKIINGAMEIFGSFGYHKASVSDIAIHSEISKAMVFTYFGSKKGCYQYLCEETLRISKLEFDLMKSEVIDERDFFKRVIMITKIKQNIMKKYPYLLFFSKTLITEQDPEVLDLIDYVISEGNNIRQDFFNENIDLTKFKNPDDLKYINQLIYWMSYGCADQSLRGAKQIDLDSTIDQYIVIVEMLRRNFYKEQYC